MFRSVVVILSVLCVCVSAQKLCGSRYEKLLNQMCAFAKETQPCLHGVTVQGNGPRMFCGSAKTSLRCLVYP